ncbi:hypothetical protein HDV00_008530 [Rhizophlyctis rosea]|nr:hypothetical protein HDV00_008530 [Rhizophlyctis rosea]
MSDIRQRQQRQEQQQPRPQNQNRAQRRQQQQLGGLLTARNAILAVTATAAVLYLSSPAENWLRQRRAVVAPQYFITIPSVTRVEATSQCVAKGGKLAELTTANFNVATTAAFNGAGANKPIHIQSFNTDVYANNIVLWTGSKAPGGSVNVNDPNAKLDALCQSSQPFTSTPPSNPDVNTPLSLTGQPATFPGIKPHTNICTSTSSNFAVLSSTGGNPTVANAAALCQSVGLAWADVGNIPGTNNIDEVRKVATDCVGTFAGAWIRSWNTDTYNNVGLEFRTGANNPDGTPTGTPIAASTTATLPVICQGRIPTCASTRQPQTIGFDAGIEQHNKDKVSNLNAGFTSASDNAYVLNGVDYPTTPSGYINGVISVKGVTFNGYGDPAKWVRGNDWDLKYLYATAAWENGLGVTFTGSKSGQVVGTKTIKVDAGAPQLVLLGFQGIDTLMVSTVGGTKAFAVDGGAHVALDDFAICEGVVIVPT